MKPIAILMIVAMTTTANAAPAEQVCNKNTAGFNLFNSSRFLVVNGSNGTEVLDTDTDLVWQRCSVGQTWDGNTCAGTATALTWVGALKAVVPLRQAERGNPDYRLPTIKELATLRETDCVKPSTNITIFANVPILDDKAALTDSVPYWSSSPYAGNQTDAWILNLWNGMTTTKAKSQTAYVRFVRAKQADIPPTVPD